MRSLIRFSVLIPIFAFLLTSTLSLTAQERDLRAERLVLDDDNGNTLVIQTPAGPITGGTLTIPDPGGSGQFLISNPAGGSQSVSGDLLPGADDTYDLGSGSSRWQDIFGAGNISLGGQLQFVETGGGTDYVGFQAPAAVTTNQVWTLPAVDGTSGQALVTDGAGALGWATAGGLATVTHNATLTGNGTGGSPLGINLGNAKTWTANQTFASTFLITSNARIAMTNSDNNGRDLRIQEPSGTGTQYIGIRSPNLANNGNYVWPAVVGSAGQVMTIATTNGIDSATLSWTTVGGGTVTGDSTLIGDGTGGSPLGLDLAQSNVWTATISTFSGFLESRNEPFVVTNTDNSANEIRIQEASGNGSNFMAFRADTSITTNDIWILPSTAGTAGEVLGITAVNTPSNRFYTLDWVTPAAAPVFARSDQAVTSGNVTLNASGVSLIRVTGSTGAFTLVGMSGGTDGKMVVVVNQTGNNMTLSYNDVAEGTAANRLDDAGSAPGATGTNATVAQGSAIFVYDGGQNRWVLLNIRP